MCAGNGADWQLAFILLAEVECFLKNSRTNGVLGCASSCFGIKTSGSHVLGKAERDNHDPQIKTFL